MRCNRLARRDLPLASLATLALAALRPLLTARLRELLRVDWFRTGIVRERRQFGWMAIRPVA